MWSWISVALSGYISIYSYKNKDLQQSLVFRLVSLGLLFVLLLSDTPASFAPGKWILASLLVSMVADVLHYFKQYSRISFISFLAAQILVSVAFWMQLSGSIVWWMPALLIATGIVAFFLLLPQLDKLIFPVMIMGGVLIQMAWAAGQSWLRLSTPSALCGFLGALLFMVSWVILAIHENRQPIKCGEYLVSGTYLLAQCLIVEAVLIYN